MGTNALAVDAMGSDKGPSEVIEGVKIALSRYQELSQIILVGDEGILSPILKQKGLASDGRVSVHHASQVITMDDKPIQGLKKKKDSSMVRAIELVKAGEAGAVLSCGNTGSLMAGGTIKLRPLKGVSRPALATLMPGKGGHFVMLDVGAEPDSSPENLMHSAILGSYYARVVLEIPKPRVGLLTIGTEEGKGNERIQLTHDYLKQLGDLIEYAGPIEGFQIFDNHVDVVVCDGFTGNVLLKASEAEFNFIKDFLKEALMANPLRKLGALLCKGAFGSMKKQLSPERFGGAPLLGLTGHVFKAHGSSNRNHIAGAIGIALDLIRCDMLNQVHSDILKANSIIKDT